MGNAASQQIASVDISLYKAIISNDGQEFQWQLFGENIVPRFYDINEDVSTSPTEWHLEFEGSVDYPDIVVSDQMQFQGSDLKCVFSSGDGKEWWALSFPDASQFAAFHQQYNGRLFENRYQTELNEDNIKKELGPYAGVDIGVFDTEPEESRQQWVEDMDIDTEPPSELSKQPRDRLVNRKTSSTLRTLVMGEGDRSYVLGVEGIGVMKNSLHGLEDLDLELSFDSLTLGGADGLGTPGSTGRSGLRRHSLSRQSTPSTTTMSDCNKGILMDSETKMNLLASTGGASNKSVVYNTDLETGGIVRELTFGDKDDIVDIVNDTKGSLSSASTFLSVGPQSVDKWDTRVKKGLVQSLASPTALEYEGGRSYKTKTKFSCIATTGKGYRAIGSQDGTIRLYSDQMTQISKTNIPSLGAPIDHIDVTYDGRWVVATTKSFLIVLKTIYSENGKELCGFTSRLGARAPKPRLLMLKPEDRVLTNNAPFEKAKLSWVTDPSRKERYIVATCGRYTVEWNFRAVKIAKPDIVTNGLTTVQKYVLIPKSEDILDTSFMHKAASPNSLVVLTKQRVWNVDEGDDEQ